MYRKSLQHTSSTSGTGVTWWYLWLMKTEDYEKGMHEHSIFSTMRSRGDQCHKSCDTEMWARSVVCVHHICVSVYTTYGTLTMSYRLPWNMTILPFVFNFNQLLTTIQTPKNFFISDGPTVQYQGKNLPDGIHCCKLELGTWKLVTEKGLLMELEPPWS